MWRGFMWDPSLIVVEPLLQETVLRSAWYGKILRLLALLISSGFAAMLCTRGMVRHPLEFQKSTIAMAAKKLGSSSITRNYCQLHESIFRRFQPLPTASNRLKLHVVASSAKEARPTVFPTTSPKPDWYFEMFPKRKPPPWFAKVLNETHEFIPMEHYVQSAREYAVSWNENKTKLPPEEPMTGKELRELIMKRWGLPYDVWIVPFKDQPWDGLEPVDCYLRIHWQYCNQRAGTSRDICVEKPRYLYHTEKLAEAITHWHLCDEVREKIRTCPETPQQGVWPPYPDPGYYKGGKLVYIKLDTAFDPKYPPWEPYKWYR